MPKPEYKEVDTSKLDVKKKKSKKETRKEKHIKAQRKARREKLANGFTQTAFWLPTSDLHNLQEFSERFHTFGVTLNSLLVRGVVLVTKELEEKLK